MTSFCFRLLLRQSSFLRRRLCVSAATTAEAATSVHSQDLLSTTSHLDTTPPPRLRRKARMAQTVTGIPENFRLLYPDMLPDPHPERQQPLKDYLEREDALKRREKLEIPEFYVGSIMAVTIADRFAPTRRNRFVGLCVQRDGYLLRHCFTLRNVVDGLGFEVTYQLYNPLVESIEVLRLERRIDCHLQYLRDAPPEYSTVPFDIEPVSNVPGNPVPINETVIPLNPPPWTQRWDIKTELNGYTLNLEGDTAWNKMKKARSNLEPWHQWDLMLMYRTSVHAQDLKVIYDQMLAAEERFLADPEKRGRRTALFARSIAEAKPVEREDAQKAAV